MTKEQNRAGRERSGRRREGCFQGKKHSPLSITQYRTAFMLFGYAVENAIKRLIVQKLVAEGQPIVKEGKIVNLDTTNHQLGRLVVAFFEKLLSQYDTKYRSA